MSRTLRWRDMSDVEREREYSPSSCLPDGDYVPFIEAYREISASSRSRLQAHTEVRTTTITYGDEESQTIDLAIPTTTTPTPPLVAFFHGGYWQELSKTDSFFAAWDCAQRGWAFAAIDYTLAPRAELSTIVGECQRAMRTLVDQAAVLGFDPANIFVAGSSAGAHLAAMVAGNPQEPAPSIRGAVLVSGIFELEPLIGTSVNDALGLDAAAAAQLSPLRHDVGAFPPAILAHGSNETTEFKAQSAAFGRRLSDAGVPAVEVEVDGRNHFDVILDLATPDTILGDAVAQLIERHGGTHADL